MPAHARAHGSTPRRGVVLVAMLALLALGGALIAGAYAAARSSARATRTMRAGIVAQAAARRAIARAISGWSGADDSLTVGAFTIRAPGESVAFALDSVDARVRVQRLAPSLFVVAADVSVPSASAPIARRRLRALLERSVPVDTTMARAPRPISRWASADLY